ncbi:hypothetical protein DN730_10320 [Marinomonas piezotolerans]|uniref:Sulfotransferase n=1 Tax=Marinomonas piezotolerans TaxID=2213058 RepID=A0A370U8C6_9GAMM|nr:sulfotransferase [Marinomonas piezotolerans]RDL44022.1 hypothetical protein DN730_10320 [Marinomonas piezotolerans]
MNILDLNGWAKSLDDMIIIGGSARSGTTMMGKLINSLENTEYKFEPPVLVSLLLKFKELPMKSVKEILQFYFYDDFLLNSLAGRNVNMNLNDDSCILHSKSKDQILNRQNSSFRQTQLEDLVKDINFSFKLPDVTFFLNEMDQLFPGNRKILMHRSYGDVISSLLMKRWFSDECLDQNHPCQVYATRLINGVKVPFWVEDDSLWLKSSEIDRCSQYYLSICRSILNANDSIVVDYDRFVESPFSSFRKLSEVINLSFTEKTDELLGTIYKKEGNSFENFSGFNSVLLKELKIIDEKVKDKAI